MGPFVRPSVVRRGDRLLALSVLCVLLALYTATMVTQPDALDGEVEFQTTSSLVRRGSFALGGTPEAEAIIAAPNFAGGTGFNVRRGGPGREDEWFSWFGVGQAFVGVPFYVAGAALERLFPAIEERHRTSMHMGVQQSEYFQHLLVGWRNPLLTALTGWLIVLCARRIGASRKSAWLAGLTYGVCTFAWPMARTTLNPVQSAFFLFLAFHQVLAIEETLKRWRRPRRANLFLCGLSLGLAFLTRSVTAPAIVVLVLAALVVLARERRNALRRVALEAGWIAAPALVCLGVFLLTNQLRFGDPLEQGYGGVVTLEDYFNYPPLHGLAGLLVSPGKGLVWMAPGLLLLPFWWVRSARRRDLRVALLVLALAAALLLPIAMTAGWHGGWSYGSRYALPILPFLWLGVGPALDEVSKMRAGKLLAGVLLGAGAVVALGGVLVDTTTHVDLAVQAARIEWPEVPGHTPADREEERFQRIVTDLRFAAPLAHWRILRHRVAGLPERFPVDEIFFLDAEAVLEPAHEREKGFRHFAWVDLSERLGGKVWPAVLVCLALLAAGLVLALRGLDHDQP